MILGFAHITKNIDSVGVWVGGGPRPMTASAPEKWPLMARRATAHRLFLSRDGGFSGEAIQYDTGAVCQPGRIEIDAADCIWLSARDRELEKKFFCEALGFNADDANVEIIKVAPVVTWWSVTLNVRQDANAPIDPPLDIAGYAALAFYSSDVEADRDHLLKHGGRTPTEPFTVTLDRQMKIVMLRSPEGTIIELIQVLK